MTNFPILADEIMDEMTPRGVHFNIEEIDFELADEAKVAAWIEAAVVAEAKIFHGISYILCSDDYLHDINLEYLNHDDYTDVITFPYSEKRVEGDIFISIERVRENAENQTVSFENELHRVMIHGALHLCGYGDKTPEDKATMTEKENFYLTKF